VLSVTQGFEIFAPETCCWVFLFLKEVYASGVIWI
jgi:hypothetical protein